jgi:hypothetical protein
VLRAVAAEQPTVSRLAELLGVSKQAASRLTEDMVSAGFLRRGGDPNDRRRTPLQLTALGDRVRARALAESGAMELELRQRFGDSAIRRSSSSAPCSPSSSNATMPVQNWPRAGPEPHPTGRRPGRPNPPRFVGTSVGQAGFNAAATGIAGEDTVGVDDGSPIGGTVTLALHPPILSGGSRAPPLVFHQRSCHQRLSAGSNHRIVVRRYRDRPQGVRGAFGPVPVSAISCRSITAAAPNATAACGRAPRESRRSCRGTRQPAGRYRPLDP